MALRNLIGGYWIFLVFPVAAAALALLFVFVTGDSYRGTTELKVDPLSSGLASMSLPNLPKTSLAKTDAGVRIVGVGSTPEAATEIVQHMAGLLMPGTTSAVDGIVAPSDNRTTAPLSANLDRIQLEQLNSEIATLESYADALKRSSASALQANSNEDLAVRASALVEVLRLIRSNKERALIIEQRLRDPIPAQPVTIQITQLPLSFGPAVISGLLGGLFAAFTVSALLAFARRNPTWA